MSCQRLQLVKNSSVLKNFQNSFFQFSQSRKNVESLLILTPSISSPLISSFCGLNCTYHQVPPRHKCPGSFIQLPQTVSAMSSLHIGSPIFASNLQPLGSLNRHNFRNHHQRHIDEGLTLAHTEPEIGHHGTPLHCLAEQKLVLAWHDGDSWRLKSQVKVVFFNVYPEETRLQQYNHIPQRQNLLKIKTLSIKENFFLFFKPERKFLKIR